MFELTIWIVSVIKLVNIMVMVMGVVVELRDVALVRVWVWTMNLHVTGGSDAVDGEWLAYGGLATDFNFFLMGFLMKANLWTCHSWGSPLKYGMMICPYYFFY